MVSSSLSSSRTSSPLTMAPTGLIRSWQTREHNSAARSRAPMADGAGDGARHAVDSAARNKEPRPCHSAGDSAIVPSAAGRARSQSLRTQGTLRAKLRRRRLRRAHGGADKITAHAAETILELAAKADVRIKADGSPVTAADEAAEAMICAGLERLAPAVPIISEEQASRKKPKAVEQRQLFSCRPARRHAGIYCRPQRIHRQYRAHDRSRAGTRHHLRAGAL